MNPSLGFLTVPFTIVSYTAVASNTALEPGENYATFVRGYVREDEYVTTPWYPIVETLPPLGKFILHELLF